MKRKILSILLISFLVIGLAGCGNNTSKNANISSNNNDTTENNTTTTNVTKEEKIEEDNQELVDTLNNTASELFEYTQSDENTYKIFKPDSLGQILYRMEEKNIKNYKELASCDTEFKEKVDLSESVVSADSIPNYDGYCTYNSWQWAKEEYNKGKDWYILVKDTSTNNQYSVKVSFKKVEFNNKKWYYPIFSNSTLLK